jgi:hypothetical protein
MNMLNNEILNINDKKMNKKNKNNFDHKTIFEKSNTKQGNKIKKEQNASSKLNSDENIDKEKVYLFYD